MPWVPVCLLHARAPGRRACPLADACACAPEPPLRALVVVYCRRRALCMAPWRHNPFSPCPSLPRHCRPPTLPTPTLPAALQQKLRGGLQWRPFARTVVSHRGRTLCGLLPRQNPLPAVAPSVGIPPCRTRHLFQVCTAQRRRHDAGVMTPASHPPTWMGGHAGLGNAIPLPHKSRNVNMPGCADLMSGRTEVAGGTALEWPRTALRPRAWSVATAAALSPQPGRAPVPPQVGRTSHITDDWHNKHDGERDEVQHAQDGK